MSQPLYSTHLSLKVYLDVYNLGVSIPRSPNSVSQTRMSIRVWLIKMEEADQVLEKKKSTLKREITF